MQLLELKLQNWGPFFGQHTIPLRVDSSAPVVIFHGENMRGKTSLLRAIVWCLYGEIRLQDGRTRLELIRMANLDALQTGEVDFGVSLRFLHNGSEYTLHRTAIAVSDRPGRPQVVRESADLIPLGGHPFPASSIPDVIDGILSHDISDFFFFDGEMLNRFEERLREDRSTPQGFVRAQVERALGLPFMSNLAADLEAIQANITANMNQALRKVKRHEGLSDQYRSKVDALAAVERDLADLRNRDENLLAKIAELDSELSKVDEIKDLYFERKNLENEVARTEDVMRDYQGSIAEIAESTWWLPLADVLVGDLKAAELAIEVAEKTDRERYRLQLTIDQLEREIGTHRCPTCGQPTPSERDRDISEEISILRRSLEILPGAEVDEARSRRDHLRRFGSGSSVLQRVHEQEQDLRREGLRTDKNKQRIRTISDQISGNTVDIESLNRNLIDAKTMKSRSGTAVVGLDTKRLALKQEVNKLAIQIAEQPEVDASERLLQLSVHEAYEIVSESYGRFRTSMRERVAAATSELFQRLTTEKEYTGVSMSDDYLLTVRDHQMRPLDMISAGANQILTSAFIGALAECSVDEAPMVMDTPFGRLDLGHRAAILRWVSTFETQVILFVQSGEYISDRDAPLLSGKIGREFSIERLSPSRSEVRFK
jgi:DNA sulfur modification protein DndD